MTRIKNERLELIKSLVDQLNNGENTSYVIMGAGPKRHLFSSLIGDPDEIIHMVGTIFNETPEIQTALKNEMNEIFGDDDE